MKMKEAYLQYYQQYEETLDQLDKQAEELKAKREQARLILKEQLKVLRKEAHKELKAIRTLDQKVKGSKK